MNLPERFLKWNYYPRREGALNIVKGIYPTDMNLFFLDSTRHAPALSTAYVREDGSIFINSKIVGMGFILKEKYMKYAIEAMKNHINNGDKIFQNLTNQDERKNAIREYQMGAMRIFLDYLYLEPEEAQEKVDFTKMSTIELATTKPYSSQHTWKIVQKNNSCCILFYRPPSLSYELRGTLTIYQEGPYYEFPHCVHDSFHYVTPEGRKLLRPVYIFNVEEVYDNSATAEGTGFGTLLV